MVSSAILLILFVSLAHSFNPQPPFSSTRRWVGFTSSSTSTTSLFGRAAAVREKTKGKTDARKTKTFATFGKKIIMAVKSGGSDNPDANKQLKDVISAAKKNNVPVDNIKRAIKKATEGNVGDFSESIFEAYGDGGASFIIHVLSDNANRANSDVRMVITKRKLKMAESGSVLFQYTQRGSLVLPDSSFDEEKILDLAIEAGVDDFEMIKEHEHSDNDNDTVSSVVLTAPSDIAALRNAVDVDGDLEIKLRYVPLSPVEVTDQEFERNMGVIDALEDLDDVSYVEHNMSN